MDENYKNLVVSLLKGASEPLQVSDLVRGLRYRGIELDYNHFEDWLLDQTDMLRLSTQGGVELDPSFNASHIRPNPIVPDQYVQDKNIDANTRLHRVIRYYIDCLRETGKSIFAYSEQQNSRFVTLDQELFTSGRKYAAVKTNQSADFVRNVHGGKRIAYYGYPLLLKWIETDDGEFANYKIIPVFIVRLDLQEEAEKCIFHLVSNTLRLNPLIAQESKWKDRSYVLEKLDAEEDQYTGIKDRLSLMEAILQQWEPEEALDPAAVVRASDLSSIKPGCSGFYNRCGIFTGGQNPYITGLISDLEAMLAKGPGHFNQTALDSLIRTASENAERGSKSYREIRVFSPSGEGEILNAPQETAVQQAFSQKISVVTGPPGTGKSQVVSAIITSAIMQDKTVLFASRNNKAIEVVYDRFRSICSDSHALVRVGGSHDKAALEMLDRLGNLPEPQASTPFDKQMESIGPDLDELDAINVAIEEILTALVNANDAEVQFDCLKRELMPRNANAYEAIKTFDADLLVVVARRFEKLMRWVSAMPALLAPLILNVQKKRGHEEVKILRDALVNTQVEKVLKWPTSKKELAESFTSLFRLVDLCKAVEKMVETTGKIGTLESLDSLQEKFVEASKRIARKVPDLLSAKVRENASGIQLPEGTQDAILQYRDMLPQLKRYKNTSDQGRQVAKSLGLIFPKVLKRLPVWTVTNLSIANRIPLEPGIFDLVVIDESSQCDIPSCLPLLYRAKQAVVIGDPLQLPQITQIAQSDEEHFLRRHDVGGPENNHLRYSEKSIYDAARRVTPRSGYQFLSNHYRCHPDIIEFANSSHWYNDRLDVFTDIKRLKRPPYWKRGIEWVQVESRMLADSVKRFHLPEEVDKTVAVVKDLLETQKYGGTVGVVCPHRGMVDRIRDKIGKTVHAHLLQASQFEAQTAHGFQGDERDVIVYAMGVHIDMPRGPKWFVAENSNLFNVALSRARAAFVVIGDMDTAESLQYENAPIEYLRDFVQYVRALGKSTKVPSGEPTFTPDQIWEERFYMKALKPSGLPVVSQYPLGPYKFDFALIRKNKNRKLDIEIDGEAFHKDASGNRLRRDIDRDIYVKAQDGRSWDVMRFWVYELREDMDGCLKQIQQWMNSAP
jgi:very-short-patch-repair endonuclease